MTKPLTSHPDHHFSTATLILLDSSGIEWSHDESFAVGFPVFLGPQLNGRDVKPVLDIANALKAGEDIEVLCGPGTVQITLEPLGKTGDVPGFLSVKIHATEHYSLISGRSAVFCY